MSALQDFAFESFPLSTCLVSASGPPSGRRFLTGNTANTSIESHPDQQGKKLTRNREVKIHPPDVKASGRALEGLQFWLLEILDADQEIEDMKDKQEAQGDSQELTAPTPFDPSRGEHEGRHKNEIEMSQITRKTLDFHPSPDGNTGAHNGDIELPPNEGGHMGLLNEGKQHVGAEGKETVVLGGQEKPQGKDGEENEQKPDSEGEKRLSALFHKYYDVLATAFLGTVCYASA